MPSLSDLIGSIFGNTQAKAANTAALATKAGLNAAYDQGQPLIAKGFADANNFLGQGYNLAGHTLTGAFGDAVGAVRDAGTGAASAITSGYGSGLAALADAYGRAQGANQAGLATITGYYQPYISAGTGAQSLYNTFLGLSGPEAAKAAAASFAGNDPGIQYRLDQLGRQSAAMANAAGYLGSGREAMTRTRAQNEVLSNDYQTYLSRLERQAGLGGQYAGQLSGFTDAAAGRSANLYANQGMQTANLSAQQGRDLASNQQLTGGRLSDLVSTFSGRLAGLDSGYYGAMANNAATQGQTLAQLLMSRETGLGSADAQLALAKGAAASQGMNNVIDIGKAIAMMAMGMPPTTGGKPPMSPGTPANGGWSTTTTPAIPPNLWSQLGSQIGSWLQ